MFQVFKGNFLLLLFFTICIVHSGYKNTVVGTMSSGYPEIAYYKCYLYMNIATPFFVGGGGGGGGQSASIAW